MIPAIVFTALFTLSFAFGAALADRIWIKRHARECARLRRLAHTMAGEYSAAREKLALHEAREMKRQRGLRQNRGGPRMTPALILATTALAALAIQHHRHKAMRAECARYRRQTVDFVTKRVGECGE